MKGAGGPARRRRIAAASVAFLLLSIVVVPATPASAYAGSFHIHDAWVKHIVFEQFGLTATETRVQMGYYQTQSAVGGNFFRSGYCYNSSFFGWSIPQCYYYLTNIKPTRVIIDIVGEFHNGSIDYQQHSFVKALSDNRIERNCYFDHGSLPFYWSSTCSSGDT